MLMNKPMKVHPENLSEKWVASAPLLYFCALMLFVGVFTSSYEHIKLMRWVVFLTFVWSAFIAWKFNRKLIVIFHCAIAVIFNPVISLHLTRDTWVVLDAVAGLLTLIIVWLSKPKNPTEAERRNSREFYGFIFGFAGLFLGVALTVYLKRSLGLSEVTGLILALPIGGVCSYAAVFIFHMIKPE
jgi:hypothetical protein